MKYLLSLFLALFYTGCAKHEPLTTVEIFDMHAYNGEWYEIAKYPNRFQKGCDNAKAIYEYENNKVKVTNICLDNNYKEVRRAKGVAKIIDTAKLEVSFFWPFYGDYWVIMLGDDYRYSVVGDPKRKYLWILSRSKELPQKDKEFILENLKNFGYDKDKLVWNN